MREIAARSSASYAADEISQGAISASLDAGNVDGIEWVPGARPGGLEEDGMNSDKCESPAIVRGGPASPPEEWRHDWQ